MVPAMAITAVTPRDRLQRLVDLTRKTMRYWWLVGLFAVVGGALSLAFAVKFLNEAIANGTLRKAYDNNGLKDRPVRTQTK